ncbi:DNA repair exonuclease SbcCD nuclease subunit [Methanofollis sp. W23]|uniref:metallophosphoesterase family protein n=1 Tax=Methanofollis sp. W23 TaxID=2817849 RepID=UPI001AE55376|nr:DNA repair exonuclease [Methanofollis sp. W23]MBP2144668.1 DNA repair exonuclease SbcCD nuclease subunit [Methanofollis sp. W23]
MKCVHIADTHLGLAAFHKIDPDTGMNLRERLVYENFLAAVDVIIRERPDAVVHAGDLFHQVRPKTRAYTTALEGLDRLAEAGIPLVVIAGNHSMAKTRYTQSPFAVLEYHGAEVHAAYRYQYETVELGDTLFHLIPNMLEAGDYRRAFDEIALSSSGPNVMVTHGLASMVADKKLHTIAEHEIDSTMISDAFEYIALGHYHGQLLVGANAWYSGSIEYCTYGELRDQKGGLVVDTQSGEVRHLDLPHTPMYDLGTIEGAGLSAREVVDAVAARVEKVEEARAMCQVTIAGVERETLHAAARIGPGECAGHLLDLKIRAECAEEDRPRLGADDLSGVDYVAEFGRFLADKHLPGSKHDYALKKGQEVLKRVIREHAEGDDAAA